jgi:acetyl esterase/lipase
MRLYDLFDRTQSAPAALYVHGGAFVRGSIGLFDPLCEQIVTKANVVVASVEYRLAPRNPFPAAPEDCYAALVWLFSAAHEVGIDSARIAIVGSSAGGGIAAGVALMARDRGDFELAFQMLLCACLDDRHMTPSSHETTDPRTWNRQASLESWRAYLGDRRGVISPYAAPARMPDLRGLPSTYLAVGQLDLVRDENIHYANRLIHARVPTELHVYPGAFHGFDQGLAPTARVSIDAIENRHNALRRALHPVAEPRRRSREEAKARPAATWK